jgi:predicted transcriptional regulator
MKQTSTETKAINMNISAEVWQRAGILAAASSATKKAIVEEAINLLWREAQGEIIIKPNK